MGPPGVIQWYFDFYPLATFFPFIVYVLVRDLWEFIGSDVEFGCSNHVLNQLKRQDFVTRKIFESVL